MYVVTNREVRNSKTGLEKFGDRPNGKGPNELRVAEIVRRGNRRTVTFLDDELTKAEVRTLIEKHGLPIDPKDTHYVSLKVAWEVTQRARKNKRHILFFVHGYNNDVGKVLGAAEYLARQYRVEVVPFSWPANGGGVQGTFDYKSDKRDARASTGALDRTLKIMHEHLAMITGAMRAELFAKAQDKHPEDAEARETLYTRLLEKECPFTVNALYHSMGNYLLKQMLKSTIAEGNGLVFDNVILCQADTNNLNHEQWVDRIRFRKRLYVTINEDDFALSASRAKAGSEQLARLGHYARNLNSKNAHYVNLTGAPWVRNSHSPFKEPAEKNEDVFGFFSDAFSGESAETGLRYYAEGNWYGVK